MSLGPSYKASFKGEVKSESVTDTRLEQLQSWARGVLRQLLDNSVLEDVRLTPVSGDASFRRYFRLHTDQDSFIAVDAPVAHEDNPRFVRICNMFRDAGVLAPKVFASDFDQGFLLQEDLGDGLYLNSLQAARELGDHKRIDRLYRAAIDALVQFQAGIDKKRLDPYDREALRAETALFHEWFCPQLLGIELSDDDQALIESTYSLLEEAALQQPQVAVHRDYHSRNLMIPDPRRYPAEALPGIVDFQDAVTGAYSYDLVSLLRDCYIRWDDDIIESLANYYYQAARTSKLLPPELQFSQLQRDMDLMGLQRHLKVLGIFSRLTIRDKKSRYLADIPLVISYFLDVAEKYPELEAFLGWFRETVLPVARDKLDLEF
jgi:aminoglycoside/choline kinase family phosphotransferase